MLSSRKCWDLLKFEDVYILIMIFIMFLFAMNMPLFIC